MRRTESEESAAPQRLPRSNRPPPLGASAGQCRAGRLMEIKHKHE